MQMVQPTPRADARKQTKWLLVLISLFSLPVNDPELAASQLTMLSQQVPLLYLILLSNAAALSYTHYNSAPKALTLILPAILIIAACWRLTIWWRWRHRHLDPSRTIKRLRIVIIVTLIQGAVFTLWALSLFPYGNAYAQCHVEFFMSLTVICCNFCLMQLRAAALLLSLTVTIPFLLFFLHTGHPVLIAIAGNMLLVNIGMILVLLRNHNNFNALIISQRELTKRQQETQSLSDENLRLANLDPLTSLPNRRRFFAELELVMIRAEQEGRRFAVALLDLDRFKSVNDVHGHAAGDRLLTQVGMRLKRLTTDDFFIARLGGDEFGIILSDCQIDADVIDFGSIIRQALQGPCVIGDRLSSITCSLGVAIYPSAGNNAQELFERADYALYHGKQNKKGGLVIFSAEHETTIRRAARLEQALRLADYDLEMSMTYQPIVDVLASRVIAFEALARWESPELGSIGPDLFIPAAERTQTIGELSAILLKKALRAALNWPASITLCFNLSAQILASAETMILILQIVQSSGLAPSRIEFEVTETALLQDFDSAAQAISQLRQLGARVALDDFGSGFSSLGYVHRLELDKIKIDKSFLTDIAHNQAAAAIIKTILALCNNLQLDCVVEGVETEAQLRTVVMLGCHHIQGYFLSKPVKEEAVTRLIEKFASLGRARALADI